jgi:hypothetical protein
VAAPADVAVHDVQPRTVVQLRVLQPLRRVELAVRLGGVVEDLGERADDVLVVVEGFVVVARDAAVALDEDLIGRVDHDLPDVVVVQERLQRAVAHEVAVRLVDDEVRVREVERA